MNFPIAELTGAMMNSYAQLGGINRLEGANLPSKGAVVEITNDLLRLLFPGFYDDRVIESSELKAETALLLDSIAGRLEAQLYKALRCFDCTEAAKRNPHRAAHDLTTDFLRSLPTVRAMVSTDIEAAFLGDPAARNREEVIVAYPGIEAVTVHRVAHELYRRDIPFVPRIMSEWAHSRSGMDIHPGAQIGSHFFVDHCTGTVIGETAKIGHHVKLYQGVGLVARSLSAGQALRGQKRHPTLEDHVTIYANATIVGGDTVIGASSTIGANVFLMHSIPANSLVLLDDVRVKVMPKGVRAETSVDFQI